VWLEASSSWRRSLKASNVSVGGTKQYAHIAEMRVPCNGTIIA
jgi:hypothetical protein